METYVRTLLRLTQQSRRLVAEGAPTVLRSACCLCPGAAPQHDALRSLWLAGVLAAVLNDLQAHSTIIADPLLSARLAFSVYRSFPLAGHEYC
jgi:hypothetical protein